MCSGRVLAAPQHVIHAAVKLHTRRRCEWRWRKASEDPPIFNRAPHQMNCDAVIGNVPLMLRHIPYFYFDNSLPRQPFSIAGYIRRGKSDVITRGRCELKRSDFGWILKMFVFCLFFLPALSCSVLHSFHLIQNCFQIQLSAPSFLLPSLPNLYQQRSSCCSASHLGLLWICVNRCTKKEQKKPQKTKTKDMNLNVWLQSDEGRCAPW